MFAMANLCHIPPPADLDLLLTDYGCLIDDIDRYIEAQKKGVTLSG